MEMTMRLPANYNVMSEEEMTYTNGGAIDLGAVYLTTGVVSFAVGAALVVNWLDLLGDARTWYANNKTGDLFTDLEKGAEAWVDYTTSSLWNGVRSILGTLTAFTGAFPFGGITVPYGPIVTALAFLTV